MKTFSLNVAGQRVDGTVFVPDNANKNPGVIFFHGAGSSEKRYLDMAEQLINNGIAVATFSMRGHGGTSEGTLDSITPHDNSLDALAVYDFFVEQEGVDKERIGICGSSYGAVIGAALLEKHSIKSVIFRVPAAYTDQMMQTNLDAILEDEERIFKALSEIDNTSVGRAIKNFPGSLLVVASENDTIIPFAIPEALINEADSAKRKELLVMKNAPHALIDPKQRQEFADIVNQWFKETLL